MTSRGEGIYATLSSYLLLILPDKKILTLTKCLMRIFKSILQVVAIVSIVSQNVMAQQSSPDAGTASALLLRFGPNPRVAGLSEAFTAIADDENALYYNIAGLPYLKSTMVSLNHTEWFEDIRIENLTFGHFITKKFGVAAGFTHMWMPGIEARDNSGQQVGTIDVTGSIFSVGFAYKIIPALSIGIGSKFFQDKLGGYSTSGFGFDAGLIVNNFIGGLSAGVAVQNFGGKINYDSEDHKIPLTYRGGLLYKLHNPDIKFALDVVKSVDTDYRMNFGVEYIFSNQFSLRVGNVFTEQQSLTPSFSAGFNFKKQYYLDYTFVNYVDLGGIHRLGFSYHFNRKPTYRRSFSYYDTSKPVQLIPPADLSVKISGDELNISWDRVAGVQYNVYAKHSTKEKWIKINKSLLYNNSMKFKKPAALGIYYFRVSSVFGGKESNFSKEVNIHVN